MQSLQPHNKRWGRRLSRLQVLTGAAAGLAGFAASPALGVLGRAEAAGGLQEDTNFKADGPATVGFDATATKAGSPVFSQGAAGVGTKYGLRASSPNVGVRGAGDGNSNSTGVLGISFTDMTETVHGDGTGVQGNSGTGIGVAGFSDTNVGVFGNANGVAGIGVSGSGSTGVTGFSGTGVGVQGSSTSGVGVSAESNAGVALVATAKYHSAMTAVSSSGNHPAIAAQNTGLSGAIRGQSGHSYGVMGDSSAKPGTFAAGVGVVGSHANGYGTGVAGYSLANQSHAGATAVPQSTGVFGTGDATGVYGQSGSSGEAVRGINIGGGIGVRGASFADSGGKNPGRGTGVEGTSGSGSGVAGFSESGDGVYGQSRSTGVSGHGGAAGVIGTSNHGAGVTGQTESGAGVKGEARSGIAIVATSQGHTKPAVYAANTSSGPAIFGQSAGGYGAELEGGKASLRLVPRNGTGAPRSGSHLAGELIVDANGNLHLCTHSGTPGMWKRVVLA